MRASSLDAGEHVAVVDAERDYFECEIVLRRRGAPRGHRAACGRPPRRGRRSCLVQGLAKGDKMETVIRHATELGVAGFVPLSCRARVLKLDAKKAASKTERWRAIAKSAAMQSGQTRRAQVASRLSLARVRALLSEATAVLVCWEEAPGTATSHARPPPGACSCAQRPIARIAVVVGP